MPNQTGPLEHDTQRLADAVYERLGEAIIDGTLEAGARIRDQDIASDLGVSRMPVREALQRLERIGLVEMSASRFTKVTSVTDKDIEDAVEFLGYQAAAATHMAVQRMNDDQRERAAALARRVVEVAATTDPDDQDPVQELYDAYNAVWAHMAVSSGNLVFSRTYNEAWFALERALRGTNRVFQTKQRIDAEMTALAAAIEAHDAAEAERLVRSQFSY